jgi:hypothetical protein
MGNEITPTPGGSANRATDKSTDAITEIRILIDAMNKRIEAIDVRLTKAEDKKSK